MLTADGDVKVLDFGLARSIEEQSGASGVNSPTLTFAGTQLGIIHWFEDVKAALK